MSQLSTPEKYDKCCNTTMSTQKHSTSPEPSKRTLSFIMQFAHSYHVEKKLPSALSGMVLN